MQRATRYGLLTAATAGVILYGSLYPFVFHSPARAEGALRALLSTWQNRAGQSDSLVNILLYAPFGFLAAQAVRGLAWQVRLVLVTLAGLTLSTGIEVAQFYDVGRDSSMADIYTNTAGALLGAAAGAAVRVEGRTFAATLLTCWLGRELYSSVPSPLEFYRSLVGWLAAAVLMEAVLGVRRGRIALVALVPGVLCARLIAGGVVSPAEVLGGVLAAILWMTLGRLRGRDVAITGLMIGLVILEALAPFQFSAATHRFGWIPFLSLIQAPVDTGIRVFLEKSFLYGGLTWLLVRCGWRWGAATAFGFLLVLALRLGQVYLPGRSAEITDAVMLLMLAVGMRWMEDDGGRAGTRMIH